MARDSETQRPGSWQQLLLVGTTVLAVGLGTGVGVWQVGLHDQPGRSASLMQRQVQPAPPQEGAVQAVPVPVGSVTAAPEADPSLVLVASDAQVANAQQLIAQADAFLAIRGLQPLNDSIVVANSDDVATAIKQHIASENAFRAANGLPPVTITDLR